MIEINFRKLRKLIKIFKDSSLTELEIREGPKGIRLSKNQPAGHFPFLMPPPIPAFPSTPTSVPPSAAKTVAEKKSNLREIKSPMVGTFYAVPSPEAEPYVQVGDIVQEGQTLCVIEAMKLMNKIPSDYTGRIVAIHLENARPAEYGQLLFSIELSEP